MKSPRCVLLFRAYNGIMMVAHEWKHGDVDREPQPFYKHYDWRIKAEFTKKWKTADGDYYYVDKRFAEYV